MTHDRPDSFDETETRMTATLPNLDLEIRHRHEGEAGEVMTLRMRAHPDMESAVRALLPALPFAMASANPMLMSYPFTAWLRLARLSWQPFLLALPESDENSES